MADPLEDLLRGAKLNDRQRAGLWDLYEGAKNPDDLAGRLKSMDLPQDLKAQLWDLKSQESSASPSWSESLGLNQPTASPAVGLMRGSGAAAVDMAQGATANVVNRVNKGGDPALRRILGAAPVEQTPDTMHAPDTFAAKVGNVLPYVAEMAVPVGGAVKAGVEAIPSTVRAGQKFQEVMGAARNIPIDVKEVGDAALRINQLAERGGSMPMAVRKILNRMTDPNKSEMVYEEARDFASNISRLSKNEYQRMTPVVAREVANLSAALNKANALAAKQAGKMDEYASAMKEYARAMRLKDAVSTAVSAAKKGLPVATGAGAAYWLTRQIRSAIGGE